MSENTPETVIERYVERHGALMFDGDSFGLPYTGIDDLVEHLRAAGLLVEGAPTDEQVERAAKVFYEDPAGLTTWLRLNKAEPKIAERYRVAMRRALNTVAGVSPTREECPCVEFEETPACEHSLGDFMCTRGQGHEGVHVACSEETHDLTHALRQVKPAQSTDRERLMEAMHKGELIRQAAWNAYADEPEGEGTRPQPDNWYRAESVLALLASTAPAPVDEAKLVEFLNSSTHAPAGTHSKSDGTCSECPWPVYQLPPDELAHELTKHLDSLRGES